MMKTLSEPSERQLLHKRTVKCFGYKRKDGLFDIEGHLQDVKNYPLSNFDRGPMKAGDPVHEMWLRLTVDLNLEIKKKRGSNSLGALSYVRPNHSKF